MLALITFLLLVPVIVCIIITSVWARICVIIASTVSYLAVLSRLTNAKMIELVLAGATYVFFSFRLQQPLAPSSLILTLKAKFRHCFDGLCLRRGK
jgi:hypothetical protein